MATTQTTPSVAESTGASVGFCKMYKVLVHNDDITTFEFVVNDICVGVFRMSEQKGRALADEVHRTGVGLAGVYPFERAEFLIDQSHSLAKAKKFPLKLTHEPA